MTYDELIALCQTGDLLIEDPSKITVSEFGLFIPGYDDERGYAYDQLIEITEKGFIYCHREPGETEWENDGLFATYDAMVGWAYTL